MTAPLYSEATLGPYYKRELTGIGARISNRIRRSVLDVISRLRINFTDGLIKQSLQLGHGWIITTNSLIRYGYLPTP